MSAGGREGARVLVAEDDRTTQLLLRGTLEEAGYSVVIVDDGAAALGKLRRERFDLVLLDVWMPRMNGLEILAAIRQERASPRAIVMTSDDAPETLLQAVKEQAYHYLTKPVRPDELLALLEKALASPPAPPIRVLSARPHWVELLVPCERDSAERIQSFMARLKMDLAPEVRESVGRVFRELLLNAIEWGGELDPSREVRISYLRAKRMLLYRIADPGKGFRFEELSHAAVHNPAGDPVQHMQVRLDKGIRPGGFGILMSQAMVDELIYNEAQNEVVFVKYLD